MAIATALGVPSNVSLLPNSSDITNGVFAISFRKNVSTIQITIGILGVLGNTIALIVFRKIKSQKVKYLIASQAVIDLLTSFTIIANTFYNLYESWILQSVRVGYLHCCFMHLASVLFALCAMSTYNLLAISIERYVLVFHPLRYRVHFTRKKEVILGVAALVIGPIMEMVYVFVHCKSKNGQCVLVNQKFSGITGVLLFLWDFFIPGSIMMFCFIRICIKLHQQDVKAKHLKEHNRAKVYNLASNVSIKPNSTVIANSTDGKGSINNGSSEYHRSRNVTKTFVFVFVMYLICWSPNQLLFLQYNLGGYPFFGNTEDGIAGSMAVLNSVCNPFIYALHMKQYREKLLPCWLKY